MNTPASLRARTWSWRILGPTAGATLGLSLLAWQLRGLDASALRGALVAPGLIEWGAALTLAGLAFVALGRAEGLVHQALATGVAPARASATGRRALALSQIIGFGTLIGAVVRRHGLPELPLGSIAAISIMGSLASLAVLIAAAGAATVPLAAIPLGTIAALLLLGTWPLARTRVRRRLPGLTGGVAARFSLWTLLDLGAAALTLFVLLPDGTVGLDRLVPAYLVALAAGALSQSPGGIGAFEATLIALLPQSPPESLLAAVLGYRLAYHALPALLAAASLALVRPAGRAPLAVATGPARDRALSRAPQAEWGLAHQGASVILSRDQASGWLVRDAGPALVALGLPLGAPDLDGLADTARTSGRLPLLYKCDGRTASAARARGWRVLRLGSEAILDLEDWTASIPACRQMRRKLRAAIAAGLEVGAAPDDPPLLEMAEVAADWLDRMGRERGFSMGRFDAATVRRQRIVLARQRGRLVAFATFHVSASEWTLDLMRATATAPDGAMQAMVSHAVTLARSAGAARLSLAAIPAGPRELAARALGWPLMGSPRGCGLAQFKLAFGPRLSPRYASAPRAASLVRGLAAVALAIHRPASDDAIGRSRTEPSAEPEPTPSKVERQFPFDPGRAPCDARGRPPASVLVPAPGRTGARPRQVP